LKRLPLFLCLVFIFVELTAQFKTHPLDQDEELGNVSWYRDYEEVIDIATKEKKQILILFQEVPGCATCKNYAKNVLTNPLMVEAIENEFVPLVIFNNNTGEDAKILAKFNEPSWNNPVIRIIDNKGNDIIDRIAGNYSIEALYQGMEMAILKYSKELPPYFEILKKELSSRGNLKETYYKMYCFWSGEKHLAQAEGVIHTEAGFMGGYEVVKVKYNPEIISKNFLDDHASNADCIPIKEDDSYRIDKDPQYYLKKSDYKYLPLSNLQKTQINSLLGQGKEPDFLLSPSQLNWLKENKNKKPLYSLPFEKAWKIKKYQS